MSTLRDNLIAGFITGLVIRLLDLLFVKQPWLP
jgi:hypothetical protein